MSNLSSVAVLELFNFRCHPNGRVGPFRRFNLLYGRNGSGKTSLLEAIEVGITSGSSRLQTGDDLHVLARSKEEPLIISVLERNNYSINKIEYGDGTMEAAHSQSELLEDIYGLNNVDGRKARYLLPQLFRTHNILYADRIVQFLHASEKKEMKRVFSELTMGTAPVDVWQRIMAASQELQKLRKEYKTAVQDLEERGNAIRNDIAEVAARDRAQLSELTGQFLRDLPDSVKEKLGTALDQPTPSRRAIAAIRSVALELQEAAKRVTKLRIVADVYDVEITESNLRRQLRHLRESRKRIETMSDDLRQELERISTLVRATILQVRKLTPILKDKEEVSTRLRAGRSAAHHLLGWIPELAAKEKSYEYRKKESIQERLLVDLNTGMNTVKGLPASIHTATLKEKREELRKDTGVIKINVEQHKAELRRYEHELAACDEGLAILKSQNSRMYELVSRLAQAVTNRDAQDDSVDCPLCGSHWEQRDRFIAAVHVQLARLAEGIDSVELERRAGIQRNIDQIRDSISGETKKLSSIQDDVERVEKELVEFAEITAPLADLCANFGVSEDRFKTLIEDRDALEEVLCQRIQEQQSSLSSLRRRRRKLWKRLREHEFKDKRSELRAKLTELARNVDELKLPVPDRWATSDWQEFVGELERLQTGAHQEWTQTRRELRNAESQLANLHSTRHEVRSKLSDLRVRNEEVTSHLESISDAINALETLRDAGFVKLKRRIVPRMVEDALNHSLVTVTNFMSELEVQLDNEQTLAVLQKQMLGVNHKREIRAREYRTCTRILKKIAQAPSLQTLQRDVWEMYSRTISSMFRKLHWPPDYERVVVDERNDNWEVLLARRREPRKLVPAHQQMSSGQRAALAISVFWSFNTSPNVPSVLLMDEPIQNIDDMNMLNFLDGLRWLVEDTDRQVFVTTANRRVETLVRKKFSYLKDEYLEIYLSRGAESLTSLEYYDWRGKRLGGEAAIA